MNRTVYECRLCGDGKHPCRLVCIGKKKPPEGCPCGCADWRPWDWRKVSECEIPDVEEESKEVKDGE